MNIGLIAKPNDMQEEIERLKTVMSRRKEVLKAIRDDLEAISHKACYWNNNEPGVGQGGKPYLPEYWTFVDMIDEIIDAYGEK